MSTINNDGNMKWWLMVMCSRCTSTALRTSTNCRLCVRGSSLCIVRSFSRLMHCAQARTPTHFLSMHPLLMGHGLTDTHSTQDGAYQKLIDAIVSNDDTTLSNFTTYCTITNDKDDDRMAMMTNNNNNNKLNVIFRHFKSLPCRCHWWVMRWRWPERHWLWLYSWNVNCIHLNVAKWFVSVCTKLKFLYKLFVILCHMHIAHCELSNIFYELMVWILKRLLASSLCVVQDPKSSHRRRDDQRRIYVSHLKCHPFANAIRGASVWILGHNFASKASLRPFE